MNPKMNKKKLNKPGKFLIESWQTHTKNRYRLNFCMSSDDIDVSYHFTIKSARDHAEELKECLS